MAGAMYKAVFQNSKIALLFAIITVLSAVSMVGTSEDSGLLPRVVSLVSNSRSHSGEGEAQPAPAESKPPSVFGEFDAQDAAAAPSAAEPQSAGPASGGGSQGFNPMTAPVAPGAVVTTSNTVAGGYVSPSEMVETAPE